eukprot:6173720-Pleurochrysis_carterae.AAC.1
MEDTLRVRRSRSKAKLHHTNQCHWTLQGASPSLNATNRMKRSQSYTYIIPACRYLRILYSIARAPVYSRYLYIPAML